MKKNNFLDSMKTFAGKATDSTKNAYTSVKSKTVNLYNQITGKKDVSGSSRKTTGNNDYYRRDSAGRYSDDAYIPHSARHSSSPLYTVEDNGFFEEDSPDSFENDSRRKGKKNMNASEKAKKNGKKKTKKVLGYIGKGFLTLMLIGILTGSIVGTVGMIYVLTDLDKDIDFNIRTLKLRYTSVLYVNDSSGNAVEYQRLHGSENRIWVDYKDIPKHVKNAIISTEDKRFWKHHGVDWKSTTGAFLNMFLGFSDTQRGGSTITQQLIKNITKNDEVSVNRKLKEIFQALELEKTYTKEEILEAYLNVIALGNGCNGIQAAANTYFDKDVSELSIAEAACIVGITQNPSKYNPLIYPEKNKTRQKLVLYNMHDQNMISKEEYDAALAEELVFNTNAKVNSETKSYNNYYVDKVIEDVVRDLQSRNGKSKAEAEYLVYSGGLQIYTEMDLKLQTEAEAIFKDSGNFGKFSGEVKPECAIVVMDYEGSVKAVVGGRGEKTGDRVLNRATGSRRQSGSAMKPLSAYAPAVESNYIEFSSLVNDSPITIKEKGVTKSYPKGGTNAPMIVSKAVRISSNCVPIRLAQGMGISTSFDFITKKTMIELLDKVKIGNKVLDDRTYSMVLGSPEEGVTVQEMTAAYAIFGNGGKYYTPHYYSKVLDNGGTRIILENTVKPTQALSSDSAYIMNRLLREPTRAGGTASSLGSTRFGEGLPIFGKTGSTNDYKDRYFCGGTPYYVSACWFGYDIPKAIPNSSTNYAMQIWKLVMKAANDSKEYKEFSKPDNVYKKEYCLVTGQIADGCPDTAVGYYKANSKIGKCNVHGSGTTPPVIIGGGEINMEGISTTTSISSASSTTTPKKSTTTIRTTPKTTTPKKTTTTTEPKPTTTAPDPEQPAA